MYMHLDTQRVLISLLGWPLGERTEHRKPYAIPTGDAQCATVTRLVQDYKALACRVAARFFEFDEKHVHCIYIYNHSSSY